MIQCRLFVIQCCLFVIQCRLLFMCACLCRQSLYIRSVDDQVMDSALHELILHVQYIKVVSLDTPLYNLYVHTHTAC